MKRAFFLMVLMCLAVLLESAQKAAQVTPKRYRVAEVGGAGSISLDGRYTYYIDEFDGDDHVFVRDLKTEESRRLTQGPGEAGEFVAISPNGKQLAYNWVLGGSAAALWEMRILGVDGSSPRTLYRGPDLLLLQPHAWSPDGEHILGDLLRKDLTYQIVLVRVSDGSVKVLKTQVLKTLNGRKPWGRITFSPDGRYIAYQFPPQGDAADRQIFVLSAERGTEIALLQQRTNDRLLDWTPDGKRILFASDRAGKWGLWAIQVFEGKPRGAPEVAQADIGPIDKGLGFTSDGSYYYAVWAWKNDVCLAMLDPATGKLQPPQELISHVGPYTSVNWSPDGRHLAYVTGLGHEPDRFVLVIRSTETKKERRLRLNKLIRFGGHHFQPLWSPDGRSLVAVGRHKNYIGPRVDSQGLYRIDARTGETTALAQTESLCWPDCFEWPVWSRNGEVIFFRWGPQSIVARDVETGQEKELYRAAGVSQLAVSPGGQRLAFIWVDRKAGKRETVLNVIPTAGGEPRELLRAQEPEMISVPAWMPDSRHIIYARSVAGEKREFELWQISAEGGEPQYLGLVMEGLLPYGLSVHPDGKRIAFTAGTPPRGELWVLKDFLPAPKTSK